MIKEPIYERVYMPESEVGISYTLEKNDYGVDGYHNHYTVTNLSITDVYLFGREWSPKELSDEFGEHGAMRILKWLETCAIEAVTND